MAKRPRMDEIVTDDDIFNHGREVLECDICAMYFLTQEKLDVHLNRQRLSRDYHCRRCGRAYTTANGLRLHQSSAHATPRPRHQQVGGGPIPTEPRQVYF